MTDNHKTSEDEDPTTKANRIKQEIADFKASLSEETLEVIYEGTRKKHKVEEEKRKKEHAEKALRLVHEFTKDVDMNALHEEQLKTQKEERWNNEAEQNHRLTSNEQDLLDELESLFDQSMPWAPNCLTSAPMEQISVIA